jgi:hypothetical protein
MLLDSRRCMSTFPELVLYRMPALRLWVHLHFFFPGLVCMMSDVRGCLMAAAVAPELYPSAALSLGLCG